MGAKKEISQIRVGELMTSDPIVISPDVSVLKVRALMKEAAIRHLPVVDEEGILGMVSDRDLAFMHNLPGVFDNVDAGDVEAALEAPVGVILKSRFLVDRDVVAVGPATSLQEAIKIIVKTGVGALPVVDDEGAVVGILSTVDILRWVADF